MRAFAGAIVALLAVGLLAGCRTISAGVQARDTLELAVPASAGMTARVETFNGGIEVRAIDGPALQASVVRTGSGPDQGAAEAARDAIEVSFEEVDGTAVLRAVYAPDPDSVPPGAGVAVTLLVPSGTPLELRTSNGPLSIEGTTGGLDAHSSNAGVELRQVGGVVEVESSNGPVTLGSDLPVLPVVATSNGAITFDGVLLPGRASFDTSNGPVRLTLPADAAFRIEAETSGSTPSTTFDLVGTTVDGSMTGRVGTEDRAGGTSIEVRTSNGPVSIASE